MKGWLRKAFTVCITIPVTAIAVALIFAALACQRVSDGDE